MNVHEALKAASDPNRLRILHLLGAGTLCVCDIEEILGIQQSNLSRHLARLKQAGLVSAEKRGQFMHYTRQTPPGPYEPVFRALYEAAATDSALAADRAALQARQKCCQA